jgi:MYXO-CTERM domain-containing protein
MSTEEQQPDDQEALRTQIEQTRAELGETVEALSAKADVKTQVKDKVDERKAQLRDQQARAEVKFKEVSEEAKNNPAPFAAAAAGGVVLLLLIRRRRRKG